MRRRRLNCLICTVQLFVFSVILIILPSCRESKDQDFNLDDCISKNKEDDMGTAGELANRTSKGGYILALGFYEQQTMAMRNCLQLQCLAHSYKLNMVEPFIVNSYLNYPFQELSQSNQALAFSQLINMDDWNRQTTERFGYNGISSWDEFLLNSPKLLVLACIMYRSPPLIRLPIKQFDFRTGCPEECMEKFEPGVTYLKKYGFTVVRKVCTNFVDYAGAVTPEAFLQNLIGTQYKGEDVTIILSEFRGFFGLYRLQIASECGTRHHDLDFTVQPSPRILNDVTQYRKRFLYSKPYVSIVVRIERIVLFHKLEMASCIQQLLKLLVELKITSDSKVLLTMDVGKYGSAGSARNNLRHYGEDIIKAVYGNRRTFKSWESSFETVAYSREAAYIANLQRTLASRSECLIMLGGGSFQAQARELYKREHPDPSKHCIHTLCSYHNSDTFVKKT